MLSEFQHALNFELKALKLISHLFSKKAEDFFAEQL